MVIPQSGWLRRSSSSSLGISFAAAVATEQIIMERSKYFTAAIGSSIGGLVLLALGCLFCCGGCLPGGGQPRQNDVEPIRVDDLEPIDRRAP
jgi:hypothetical protein